MNLNLHKNARTTPAIRQERRESTKSEREMWMAAETRG